MPLSRPPTPIRTRTEKSAAGVGLAVEVDIYLEPVTKPSTDSQRPTIRQYRFFRPGGLFTVFAVYPNRSALICDQKDTSSAEQFR